MLSRHRAVISALVAVLTVGLLGAFVLAGGRQDGAAVQSSTLTAQITAIPQGSGPCPSPSDTASPTVTPTGSSAPAPSADTTSPADSASPTDSVMPTGTATPCPSPSTSTPATPTGSASPTGTGTPAQAATPTPTTTPPTATPTPTPTPTPTQAVATLTLTAPKSVAILKPFTLTGNLAISGGTAVPGGTTLKVTRSGPSAKTFSPVNVASTGTYSLTDTPPAYGTYTYTASYAGTTTISSATATYSVTVTRLATTLSLASSASIVNYQAKVTVTAHLGTTYTGRQVSIYAQTAGSTTKLLLKTGTVSSTGYLAVTYSPSYSKTFSVTFPGDARYAPQTATRVVSVWARVTQVISGYYASETYAGSLYRVYHHTATLADTATVAPNKHGECAYFQVQVYFSGTWTADVTTGCGTLSAASQVFGRFNLATAAGARYRIRAWYEHTNGDVTNASAPSGWLYFRVAS